MNVLASAVIALLFIGAFTVIYAIGNILEFFSQLLLKKKGERRKYVYIRKDN